VVAEAGQRLSDFGEMVMAAASAAQMMARWWWRLALRR
jgi:hypothetical protein